MVTTAFRVSMFQKILVGLCRKCTRAQQTIRRGYAATVETSLQFPDSGFDSWLNTAKNHEAWADQVERSLELESGIYKPFKKRRLMF